MRRGVFSLQAIQSKQQGAGSAWSPLVKVRAPLTHCKRLSKPNSPIHLSTLPQQHPLKDGVLTLPCTVSGVEPGVRQSHAHQRRQQGAYGQGRACTRLFALALPEIHSDGHASRSVRANASLRSCKSTASCRDPKSCCALKSSSSGARHSRLLDTVCLHICGTIASMGRALVYLAR
jgi:hypothetical protein